MSKKKKGLLFGGIAAVLLVALILVYVLVPVTYDYDKAWIQKNPDYDISVTEKGGYTTLVSKDGSFKIIGFTDTHLDHKKEKGDYTLEYVIRNIVREKPDFVVFVGDNITSAVNDKRAHQFARVMEELGVYWTCVLGNHEHDNPWSVTRRGMLKIFASYEHCLVDPSPKRTASGEKVWGNGNQCILLSDAAGNITQALYFLDGGAYMTDADLEKYADEIPDLSANDYDYVKPSQIQWYKETVADVEKLAGKNVKSVMFDHIALPEMLTAYEGAGTVLMGEKRESVCASGHNSGLFDAILEAGSTQAFICGHDHINDFAVLYKGIILAYNQNSGYSSYNLVSKGLSDTLLQGFTRYTISKQGEFSMEHVANASLYPEDQPEIVALYK